MVEILSHRCNLLHAFLAGRESGWVEGVSRHLPPSSMVKLRSNVCAMGPVLLAKLTVTARELENPKFVEESEVVVDLRRTGWSSVCKLLLLPLFVFQNCHTMAVDTC